MDEIKVFVPATVSNVSCGFDIMGFPVEEPGDVMIFRKRKKKEIVISRISCAEDIPRDAAKNVAGVVSRVMLEDQGMPFGLEIEIEKGIRPGSGIGSSGASSAGAAWAVNRLLGDVYGEKALVSFAMVGEQSISGALHADNVAPALLGGFILIPGYDPLELVRLPYPEDLFCTIFHPQIEIRTKEARDILKKSLLLKDAVRQWGNVAGLVAGLMKEDYALIARSLEDVVAEPVRSLLIPSFDQLKQEALAAGALGCSLSGSGPALFALSRGRPVAEQVKKAMEQVYRKKEIRWKSYVSAIAAEGVKILS
jgi:homoserine kinase